MTENPDRGIDHNPQNIEYLPLESNFYEQPAFKTIIEALVIKYGAIIAKATTEVSNKTLRGSLGKKEGEEILPLEVVRRMITIIAMECYNIMENKYHLSLQLPGDNITLLRALSTREIDDILATFEKQTSTRARLFAGLRTEVGQPIFEDIMRLIPLDVMYYICKTLRDYKYNIHGQPQMRNRSIVSPNLTQPMLYGVWSQRYLNVQNLEQPEVGLDGILQTIGWSENVHLPPNTNRVATNIAVERQIGNIRDEKS